MQAIFNVARAPCVSCCCWCMSMALHANVSSPVSGSVYKVQPRELFLYSSHCASKQRCRIVNFL
eukprot:19979-Heterococcus_DN1.PRE.1